MKAQPASQALPVRANRFAAWTAGILVLACITGLQGCTDAVTNPQQVVPVTGLVYRGNGLYMDTEAVLDSATGTPVHLVFARPSGRAEGTGTYESPFGLLSDALRAARPGDLLLVTPGADPRLSSFTIPDGVRVYSSHPFQTVATAGHGLLTLPLTGSEPPPRVDGTVTLGNDCALSGFQIHSDDGPGIRGADVSNVTITHNRLLDTAKQGIYLTNVGGAVDVHHNRIFATRDSTCPGIYIDNSRVTVDIRLFLNSISDPSGDGIKILTRGTGVTVATVDSNTVTATFGSGIKFFSLNHANTTAVITNNIVSRVDDEFVQDAAIRFGTFDDIRGDVTVANNRIFNCSSNGVFIGSENQARTEVTILSNDISECRGNGVFVGAQQTSFQKALISGNLLVKNRLNPDAIGFPTGQGIFVGSLYSGRVDPTIVFNRCYENEQIGIFCATFNSGKMTGLISDNIIANNLYNGLEMNCGLNVPPPGPNQSPPPLPAPGENNAQFTVYNNVIAGNRGAGLPGMEGSGVQCLAFNGASVDAVLQNNHVNFNAMSNGGYAGLGILVFHNSTARFALRNNSFAENYAAPAVNARTFSALPGTPPEPGMVPRLCLELTGNVSDTGYILTRDDGTEFEARMTSNTGPLMVPFPLDNDRGCTPPAPLLAGFPTPPFDPAYPIPAPGRHLRAGSLNSHQESTHQAGPFADRR